MNVILIETDLAVSQRLEQAIAAEKMNVTTVTTEEDAKALTATGHYDMVLIGEMHDDHVGSMMAIVGQKVDDAEAVARHFRASSNHHHVKIPLLALTRNYNHSECARVLNAGADDYESVSDVPGVIARMHAVLRRSLGHSRAQLKFSLNTYFDFQDRQMVKDGKVISLTPKESGMLFCLLNHRGQTVTKETIMHCLYQGMEGDTQIKIIDVFMSKLRKKLNNAGVTEFRLATDYGNGYRAEMLMTPLTNSFSGSACRLEEKLSVPGVFVAGPELKAAYA